METPEIPKVESTTQKSNKKIVKTTVKKKKTVLLPELQTYIVQPNRVTNAIFDGFSLLQLKAFAAIMLNLQGAVKESLRGVDISQLSLFNKFEESVKFDLSLKDITNDPTSYGDVKNAISRISELNVKLPLKDEDGKTYHLNTSLITALIPEQSDYKTTIKIKIERAIAEYLVMIEKGKSGIAQQYTRYMLQVALQATSTYTIRIYQLISSWKSKGGYTVPYKEFRTLLAISEDKYAKFSDFKRKVLMPAQNDLFEKADCWFNCDIDGFKTMRRNADNQKELYLNFKIITPEFVETMIRQRTAVVNLLSTHFNFKDLDLKKISFILDNEAIPTDLIARKILDINEAIEASYKSRSPVRDKKAYALQSLLAHHWSL